MATYLNPNAVKDHSITLVKLADGAVVTDASIAAMGYTKNQGTITGITMNGTSKGTSGVVNLGTVITDVSNLATKNAAIGSLSISLDSTNYKITLSGTKVDGSTFTVQNVIDLPLESVVVNGRYDSSTKKVILTLQSGSTIDFSVADLVAGLQSEITSSNKLSADFISDGTTNKTVTATEKNTWNGKQNAISDLDTIRANASAGAAKVSNVQSDWDATTGLAVILNKPTIPAAPGTLKTNNTSAQTASASESLSGTINLHKVAKTGTYSDLIGTPVMTSDASVAAWGYTKNEGTITGITMNSSSMGTSGVVDLGTVITAHAKHKLTATNQNATAATGSITFVESLTGTTTATDGDLTITATRKSITVPSAPGTLNTTATTAQSTSSSEALSGNITLHKVAKTGTYSDLIGTPTIPTVNNATLTIQKNGTTVQTFTANASSNATANISVNELPTVTSSDNGKVLMVVNGAWAATTPVSIYSGSDAPNNSQGINGDLYLQI